MRDADQLHERVARRDLVRERERVERVANDRLRSLCKLADRRGTNQRAHGVSAPQELRDEVPADVAGGAGEEEVHDGITSVVWDRMFALPVYPARRRGISACTGSARAM